MIHINRKTRKIYDYHKANLQEIVKQFDIEIDPIPIEVKSAYGQTIQIYTEDGWNEKIQIFVPGYHTISIHTPKKIHVNILIDHIFKSFLVSQIEHKSSFDGIAELSQLIPLIHATNNNYTEAFTTWISELYLSKTDTLIKARPALKNFIQYCHDEYIEIFDEYVLANFISEDRRISGPPKNTWIKTFDPVYGPYSKSELLEISNTSVNSDQLTSYEKSLILITRDTGARPIQLALLRLEDLKRDHIGPYISIPSAKGISRSKKRRANCNFKDRYIDDCTEQHIHQMITDNEKYYNNLDFQYANWCIANRKSPKELPRALFPKRIIYTNTFLMFEHETLKDYSGHNSSGTLSQSITGTTSKLNIKTPRSDLPLYISAYRLRRTLATQMILQGYGMDEVAEALDHQSTQTIKHYFSINRDILDYVNFTSEKSNEIKNSYLAWEGLLIEENDANNLNEIRLTAIDKLGICKNKNPCDLHPTISCYSCHSFRPYKTTAHSKALDRIVEYEEMISSNSTGGLNQQIQNAKDNAIKLIEIVSNDR